MSGKSFIMVKGLPASGKSTWAREHIKSRQGWIRINNDELRLTFFNRVFSKADTKHIDVARETLIELYVTKGLNIIVDNCNLHPKHEQNYKQLAEANGYKFTVQDFTHIPLAECIARDRIRQSTVGSWVILDMYNHFLRKEDEPKLKLEDLDLKNAIKKEKAACANQNKELPKAIICDLDGTIALIDHRDPYDASNCHEDELNEAVHAALTSMKANGYQIIFVSGRQDQYSKPTRQFLREKCGLKDTEYLLFMRKTGDFRKDSMIKQEIYENFIRDSWYIEFVLDDRNQVVDYWRSIGLVCFQVAPGNF